MLCGPFSCAALSVWVIKFLLMVVIASSPTQFVATRLLKKRLSSLSELAVSINSRMSTKKVRIFSASLLETEMSSMTIE